eukprot:CAMPEP_0115137498 /NCGR_PEP_ID=MMETSP0227-20121206/57070_1 /TAXON_ID=89957 /ORGANISM="Polarella glacialis, Strain CCMP 1383" /LENGTH=55 /DNA_ID=CAMNT_0002544865 /DNA_START=41 /DNA_END=205 /DNA_ORIENTATION=-
MSGCLRGPPMEFNTNGSHKINNNNNNSRAVPKDLDNLWLCTFGAGGFALGTVDSN